MIFFDGGTGFACYKARTKRFLRQATAISKSDYRHRSQKNGSKEEEEREEEERKK